MPTTAELLSESAWLQAELARQEADFASTERELFGWTERARMETSARINAETTGFLNRMGRRLPEGSELRGIVQSAYVDLQHGHLDGHPVSTEAAGALLAKLESVARAIPVPSSYRQ